MALFTLVLEKLFLANVLVMFVLDASHCGRGQKQAAGVAQQARVMRIG
jgi:hypothetical protein